jgi:hypothetical protein
MIPIVDLLVVAALTCAGAVAAVARYNRHHAEPHEKNTSWML